MRWSFLVGSVLGLVCSACTTDEGAGGADAGPGADAGTVGYRGPCPPGTNDPVFFAAEDGQNPWSMYWTEGTPASTFLAFPLDRPPRAATRVGDELYYSTRDSEVGQSWLWRAGSPGAAPVLIKMFMNGLSTGPEHFMALGSVVLFDIASGFPADAELWVTDGTESGTSSLGILTKSFGPFGEVVLDGTLYFLAGDPQLLQQVALWRSDGTPAGTRMIAPVQWAGPFDAGIVLYHGELYFPQISDTGQYQLWKSDGTTEGTTLVIEIEGSYAGSRLPPLVLGADRLFFHVWSQATGHSVWISDGTALGTTQLIDFGQTGGETVPMVGVAEGAYFVNFTPDGVLWRSDGTIAGTAKVTMSWNAGRLLVPASQGRLFFNGYDNAQSGLLVTDGTDAGTVFVTQHFVDSAPLVPAGDSLLFTGFEIEGDNEPWISDGTAAGTIQLADLNPGAGASNPSGFTSLHCAP